jgi:hypothetical protein
MWKMVGQHLYLNIIFNNFIVKTGHSVWCDQGMSEVDVPNLHNISFGVQMQGSQGLKASSVLWWIVYLNN